MTESNKESGSLSEWSKHQYDFLKAEYPVVNARWITVQGLRYGGILFLAGVNGTLGKYFRDLFDTLNTAHRASHDLIEAGLIALPVIAIIIAVAVFLFERRMHSMDVACSLRAADIEKTAGFTHGLSSRLNDEFKPENTSFNRYEAFLRFIFFLIIAGWMWFEWTAYQTIFGN